MTETLDIHLPRVYRPLLDPARYKGAYGGRASGKSHVFATLLVLRCLDNPGTRALCVREIQRSLEESVKRLIEDKIRAFGLADAFRIMESKIHTPGGGVIVFIGMQKHTAESVKSYEGFDLAWVEEAQSLSQRSLDLLRPTIRKAGSEIWFSWNPRLDDDPVDTFLRHEPPADAIVVRANWSDNPWLPDEMRAELEHDRRRDPDKYAHVWLGEYERHSEARVFRNWTVADPDEPDHAPCFSPPEGTAFYFGADWGFSNDPTVLVRCFIQGRTLFVDWCVDMVGCEIDQIAALFDRVGCERCDDLGHNCGGQGEGHGMARRWVVTADSSRPDTIAFLRRKGYPRIRAAKKGADSVKDGVEFLKSYDIVVHPRCTLAIDELSTYSYKTDSRTGEVLPVLVDDKNHFVDSARYALESVRRPPARSVRLAWG